MGILVLLVLAGVVLAGCGSENDAGADGRDPDAPVTSTPDPQPTGPVKAGAERVEPQPGMADVRPHGFEKVKILDERHVRVFFYQGVAPCSVLDRVEVTYGTKKIGITLHVGHDPDAEGQACIELAVYNYVDVELDEPLDGRRIVDAARRPG